jgi:hypothetical protein
VGALVTPHPPTLELTAGGSTLVEVLAAAKAQADRFFDGVPYRITHCDARPEVFADSGGVLHFTADVRCSAYRSNPNTDPEPDDDTEEVPIP